MIDSRAAKKLHCDTLELEAPPPLPFFDGEWVPAQPKWNLLTICKNGDWCCILDDEDYRWALQWIWFIIPSGYAVRSRTKADPPGGKLIYLHREINLRLDPIANSELYVSDHLNGCSLDNRRENLRWASLSDNARNRHGSYWRQRQLW